MLLSTALSLTGILSYLCVFPQSFLSLSAGWQSPFRGILEKTRRHFIDQYKLKLTGRISLSDVSSENEKWRGCYGVNCVLPKTPKSTHQPLWVQSGNRIFANDQVKMRSLWGPILWLCSCRRERFGCRKRHADRGMWGCRQIREPHVCKPS